jgi:hypothetical protein
VQDKVTRYLQYGVRLVWVGYPKLRQVVAHTANGARTYRADDLLDGADVLPGFGVRVGKLFR